MGMDRESEFQKLFQVWKSRRSDEDFDAELLRVFLSAPNPFDSLIALAAHKDKPKQTEFLRNALSGWVMDGGLGRI